MLKRFLFTLVGGLAVFAVRAQSRGVFIPLNADYYHLIERYEIRSGRFAAGFHGQVRPYRRRDVVQLAENTLLGRLEQPMSRAVPGQGLSKADRFNLRYLRNDSWEWASDSIIAQGRRPLFSVFYKKQPDFYSSKNEDFEIHANPVFGGLTGVGQDVPGKGAYLNTRGVEIRGSVGKKVGFYTFLTDNQLRMPDYFTERVLANRALPGEGLYKEFKGQANTFDFFTARAYITFDPIKQINLQFGQDKVFMGTGVRSVILSDFSAPFTFLKITTQLGPVQYQNIFGELINNQNPNPPYGVPPPKKFIAFHHLSINLGRHLNLGLFETVIHSRGKDQGYFDLRYLNPVIFYRAIEGEKNSPDNVLLGLDFRANFLRHFSLYGQAMLDEFKADELLAGKGWWGNKVAAQLGLKYIDAFGIANFDLQGELNVARPYTYQHLSDFTNYVHYNQPLAHPLGANFIEFVGVARYQPLPRLALSATYVQAQYGADRNGLNWGGNPLVSYNSHFRDFGNTLGQGRLTSLSLLDAVASYQLTHNVFLELRHVYRLQNARGDTNDRTTAFSSFGVRVNLARRDLAF